MSIAKPNPAPQGPPAWTPLQDDPRLTRRPNGAVATAVASGLTTVLLIASFVVWSNRYLPVVYNADETSTTPHFPAGFMATGILEAAALILSATITLVVGTLAVSPALLFQAGPVARLSGVGVAALLAVAIPVVILRSGLAVVPLIFAAVLIAVSNRAAARGGKPYQ